MKTRVESLLAAKILGDSIKQDDATWLAGEGALIRPKLATVGLCEGVSDKSDSQTLEEFLSSYIALNGPTRKPGTIAVWKQVESNLVAFLPKGIGINQTTKETTKGHAKQFHEHLKGRGLASLTIQKHIRIARQMLQNTVDWEYIQTNPFAGLKVTTSSIKSNVDVPPETVARVMSHCDLTWKAIIAISRFGGLRTPSETLSIKWTDIDWEGNRLAIPEPKVEHHEGRGVRSCPLFPELRAILEEAFEAAPEGAEFVIDKPAYRAAANTGTGWKNANLRTQFMKILRKAGVAPWARLFHSMRASRQTELERKFPLHVVCAWLGNSPKVAQRSYLLVTEEDFKNATAPTAAATLEMKSRGTNPTRGTKNGIP